jgi:hypothetical protein
MGDPDQFGVVRARARPGAEVQSIGPRQLNALPAVSGAAIAAIKVMTASTIR